MEKIVVDYNGMNSLCGQIEAASSKISGIQSTLNSKVNSTKISLPGVEGEKFRSNAQARLSEIDKIKNGYAKTSATIREIAKAFESCENNTVI